MTQPSSKVQQTLSATLLQMLQQPDLSPEDAEWLQQFALRTITEFSLDRDKDKAPGQPIAA
jgi:hypothetical protein